MRCWTSPPAAALRNLLQKTHAHTRVHARGWGGRFGRREDGKDMGCADVADVAATIRPRYHFAASHGVGMGRGLGTGRRRVSTSGHGEQLELSAAL